MSKRSGSTGPKSIEGKAASSRNSLKHGLTAVDPVVPSEDRRAFDVWTELWKAELAPEGAVEEFLAWRISSAAWRLLRVERLEGAFNRDTIRDYFHNMDDGSSGPKPRGERLNSRRTDLYGGLAMLARHESAIERSFYAALRTLQGLQEDRREQPAPIGFTPPEAA